jgi:hypothetical protein
MKARTKGTKQTSATPATGPITAKDLSGNARESLLSTEPQGLDKLRAVDPVLVRAIVANGPLNSTNATATELIDSIVEALAERSPGWLAERQALDRFCLVLRAAGLNDHIPVDHEDGKRTEVYLADLAFNMAMSYADAAYLLGVLVGREMAGAR